MYAMQLCGLGNVNDAAGILVTQAVAEEPVVCVQSCWCLLSMQGSNMLQYCHWCAVHIRCMQVLSLFACIQPAPEGGPTHQCLVHFAFCHSV